MDEARKRGEIPKSTDLSTAAAYAGFVLVGLVGGTAMLQHFGQAGLVLLDQPDRLAPLFFGNDTAPIAAMSFAFASAILPIFAAPMLGVALMLVAQRAVHFAPEKLSLKWSRISPLANAKQKFGREGLFEFGKSFAKLLVVALILTVQLSENAADILASLAMEPAQSMALMLQLLLHFMLLVVLTIGIFGGVDYFWQQMQHRRRNMMSRKDLIDEMKDSEGDPHVKQQRRQRAQQIATNRLLQDVAKADVIVVNPSHYAVALKWSRKGRAAPICVAKGVDEVAARIRAKAAEAGVPLQSDPPTARAIYATVDIGQQIRPEHYRAVAAAIRFAEAMRKRRKIYVK
ncbi:flagellar type III secretion system protein FlhB [Cypionkella sp.]|uniref:flagellar type III secretion system protein FlhB n=1 Tax=Cypionkella sp. TaxID=2811411 RepID=UPI0026228148|nr:flagellar type III secretion system protein FlhB [Cypionkella sp.]